MCHRATRVLGEDLGLGQRRHLPPRAGTDRGRGGDSKRNRHRELGKNQPAQEPQELLADALQRRPQLSGENERGERNDDVDEGRPDGQFRHQCKAGHHRDQAEHEYDQSTRRGAAQAREGADDGDEVGGVFLEVGHHPGGQFIRQTYERLGERDKADDAEN